MQKIVLISGRTCNGKSALAQSLKSQFDYHVVRTSDILKKNARKRGLSTDRQSLERLGNVLDKETDYSWVYKAVITYAKRHKEANVIVDSIRQPKQLSHFRNSAFDVSHIHLYAPKAELEKRYKDKCSKRSNYPSNYEDADLLYPRRNKHLSWRISLCHIP